MARARTKFFDSVEYDEESVLEFPVGLAGFEDQTRFLPLNRPGSEPIVFLQSVLSPDLCFVTLPVLAVDRGYAVSAADEDLELIGFPPGHRPSIGTDAMCLALLTLNGDAPPTANLMSPVLVNLATRKAVQIIQTQTAYSHQHSLAPLLAGGAC